MNARAVLEERARQLARALPLPPAPGEVIQVVVFALGDETYALETQYVREVVRVRDSAALPGAPPFVFGAMNLRGEVHAVMDLRPFFDVPQREPTDCSRVLVLGTARVEFGLLVDSAHDVRTLRRDGILDPPASVQGAGREFLLGVTAEALVVLDGAVLLREDRLFVDDWEPV
jgi:purine-binding chemotaxis protein CheW